MYFLIKQVASEEAFSILLSCFIGNPWGHRIKLRSQRDLCQIEFVTDICYRFSLEMEEEAVDLKMNSTLFVPEQSISGGVVREGRRMLKKTNLQSDRELERTSWGHFL